MSEEHDTRDHDERGGRDARGDHDYCGTAGVPAPPWGSPRAVRAAEDDGPPHAECVLCREPTEYPESYKGITLCPACAWQEAQRSACSG
ncbi:hypothetical protein [Streptomyces minutiscleroticus]|uniref:Uncharacterized protein n=1 Tax=Streptomyces minutiscleroticus TaxID=68238 RepID=A0A918NWD2_9ACTN|nr:hypothetical protein [Streptomyces minutiscleroticus]GGY02304.1 hypothetical protein GCM10010358_65310 [Streptomyces minutiscleroticus]